MKLKQERNALRELGLVELRERLVNAKQELFNLRFQLATGHLNDSSRVGQVKRQIARIHTAIRELELKETKHV
ncbi:MAG: 50S ribosomal protein L29 [Burkholderiales bacterium]|nr:50S ribosomal protein L29 [Burkholderiales bacterium]